VAGFFLTTSAAAAAAAHNAAKYIKIHRYKWQGSDMPSLLLLLMLLLLLLLMMMMMMMQPKMSSTFHPSHQWIPSLNHHTIGRCRTCLAFGVRNTSKQTPQASAAHAPAR
jgi:hypothetical protein